MADAIREARIEINARDNTKTAFQSLEHSLRGVKEGFGKRGLFGDLGELLVGGGAIAGVTFLAARLDDIAVAARNMAVAFEKGEKSATELFRSLAGGLPLVKGTGALLDIGSIIESKINGGPSIPGMEADVAGRKAAQDQIDKDRNAAFDRLEQFKQGGSARIAAGEHAIDLAKANDDERASLQEQFNLQDSIWKIRQEANAMIAKEPGFQDLITAAYDKQSDALIAQSLERQKMLKAAQEERDIQQQITDEARMQADVDEVNARQNREQLELLQQQIDENNRQRDKEAESQRSLVHLTGRASFEQAGIVGGGHEMRGDDSVRRIGEKQLTFSERAAKSLEAIQKAVVNPGPVQSILR